MPQQVSSQDIEIYLFVSFLLLRFPQSVESFKWDKPMAMASILTTDYNVTWDIGKDRLRKFIFICQTSHEFVKNNLKY